MTCDFGQHKCCKPGEEVHATMSMHSRISLPPTCRRGIFNRQIQPISQASCMSEGLRRAVYLVPGVGVYSVLSM
jgi:hypothetical protein